MVTPEEKQIVEQIRKGEIDVNNQSLFFSILIKGLLTQLNKRITIRDGGVPTFILHTGDDTMYLDVKGQDASIEPGEISNEKYVYNAIPRCLVQPKSLDIQGDQMTSPYSWGVCQLDIKEQLYTLSGEFRRYPIKMGFDLAYYVDSYTDSLELMQQIISKLAFIQTYKISYLGQEIICSYSIPTSMNEEHLMELEGTTQDRKERKIELTIEVETNYPVWQNKTIVPAGQWIAGTTSSFYMEPTGNIQDYEQTHINDYNQTTNISPVGGAPEEKPTWDTDMSGQEGTAASDGIIIKSKAKLNKRSV